MNLASLLMDHPVSDGGGLLHTIDRTVTAGETRAAAASLASRLGAAGVQAGQAVAVQLPDSPETVEAMFGVWLAGAVLVPLNPRLPEAEVRRVLSELRPAAALTESGLTRCENPARFDDDVAFVTWTSGTTGAPKAVLHTHSGYLELLDRVLGPLGGNRDRTRPPMPNIVPVALTLNAGIYNVLFGLRAGAPLVLMERFDTTVFARLVARFQIRSAVLPPAAMVMLSDDTTVENLEPLRYVRAITAPLSPLQARRFHERFRVTVLNGYGQAEIGEVIGWTAADAREHPEKLGAVGRPHPGVTLRIEGAAEPDVIGELQVRPPRMASGYASGGELTDRIDQEGFVSTGDLARIDAEGFVWIEGRVGDVINRGGNKVFPAQVEEVLRLAPSVRDAAVVAVPDSRLGELPVAFVEADEPVPEDELIELCRTHLVPYKIPAQFHLVDQLPRNEVGKVLRAELTVALDADR